MTAGLVDHLIGSVLRVGDDVIAGDADHRDAPLGEVATERGEPGGDVLDVRAVVTDEGDDERGTRELLEADRNARGRLGQSERRGGGSQGEHCRLDGHVRQGSRESRSATSRPFRKPCKWLTLQRLSTVRRQSLRVGNPNGPSVQPCDDGFHGVRIEGAEHFAGDVAQVRGERHVR